MLNLFSTYSQGENRVTATCMAVFQRLTLLNLERLLSGLMGTPEKSLVEFQNQPSAGASGNPDAQIAASFRLLVETKIKRNSTNADQLRRHLGRLAQFHEVTKCLLLLTPDGEPPQAVVDIRNSMLVWQSFANLNAAIDDLLGDKSEVTSEREMLLLRELQKMMHEENLLGFASDTVVVPAKNAWEEYNAFDAYVCQPGRSFERVEYLAFYKNGVIRPIVPRIAVAPKDIVFNLGPQPEELRQYQTLVEKMIRAGARAEGAVQKVFLLSSPNDSETVILKNEVRNDNRDKNGNVTAYTMNQRYVALERLKQVASAQDVKDRVTSRLI